MKIYSPTITGSAANTNVITVSQTGSLTALSSSFAATSSYANSFTVGGTLTAQTINVQIITSSIEFNTGSTRNGALSSNTHEFTGSVLMSGSLTVTTTGTELQVNASGVNIGNALTDNHIISGSLRINPNGLFVSSSGNVGIGTDNPIGRFTISNSGNYNPTTTGAIGGSRALRMHILGQETGLMLSSDMNLTTAAATGTQTVQLGLQIGFYAANDVRSQIYFGNSPLTFVSSANQGDSVTECMRITSTGNVGIGTTSPSAKLHVDGAIFQSNAANGIYNNYYETYNGGSTPFTISASGASASIQFFTAATEKMRLTTKGDLNIGNTVDNTELNRMIHISDPTASSCGLKLTLGSTKAGFLYAYDSSLYLVSDSSYTIRVAVNGTNGVYMTAGSTSWTANSDERLKNINSNIENAVEKLTTLRTVNYSWKSDELNRRYLGLIAQDVEKVLPEVVDTENNEDKTLGVRYTELIPVLVKAIQELKSENDTLKEILQRNNIQ